MNEASGRSLSKRKFLQLTGASIVGVNSIQSVEACSFASLPKDFVYLNSGTEGSMPDCVTQSLQNSFRQWASDPTTSYEENPNLGKRQPRNRSYLEKYLGVGENQITVTDNTTMGLNLTLMGLNFSAGDKVITTNHEHNAILSPLQIQEQRQNIQIVSRKFPAANALDSYSATELIEYLFPNVPDLRGAKALCVSHVYPATGIHLPLKLLRQKADELGIKYLIVDGAQAFGMFDITSNSDKNSVSYCDFYAAPGHKWLNGPPGTGFLYLKNDKIRPPEFYPLMSQRMSKFLEPGAEEFPMAQALQVRGCCNAPGFLAMTTAIDYLNSLGGASKVEEYILALSHDVKSILKTTSSSCLVSAVSDGSLNSGLTVFFPFSWQEPDKLFKDKATAYWVVKELLEKHRLQIRAIGIPRPDGSGSDYALRVSIAQFTTKKHISYFAKTLQQVLSRI